MNKVEKIREEIKKRYEYWKEKESNSHSIESESRMSECQYLLLLFNNLQEESISNDLKKAAIEAFKQIVDSDKNSFLEIFKAGAEWGMRQMEAKIQAQSTALAHGCPKDPVSNDLEEAAWVYYDKNKPLIPHELDLHKELIDFFKAGVRWKEQNDSNLSEVLYRDNLDEMAEEYSSCTYLEEVLGEGDIEVLKARLKNTFKAGAQWQKQQLMENAMEAVIHPYDGEIWVDKDLLSIYNDCQRVKLIIIKEE